MNCLVTGGAGFIGSHIADALIAAGHSVRIIDDLSSGQLSNLPQKAEFHQINLLSSMAHEELYDDIDVIFHEAAIPSVPKSIKSPINTQRSGEVATLSLLQTAVKKKVKRIVFAASSSAYGLSPCPQVETMLPSPLSPYAVSKVACENYIKAFCHCHDIEGVSLRYFNVFGPRQDASNPYSGVISIFAEKMRANKAPTIFGDGTQTRDFTYIDNVVQANLLAMSSPRKLKGEIFNVGCGQSISLNDLVKSINDALNTDIKPSYAESRVGDIQHSFANINAIQSALGYTPSVNFSDGLRRFLN